MREKHVSDCAAVLPRLQKSRRSKSLSREESATQDADIEMVNPIKDVSGAAVALEDRSEM
jgi:hypothetical protein